MDRDKINTAATKGIVAFWEVVAAEYPEVIDNNLLSPIELMLDMQHEAERIITAWLEANQ